MEQRAGDILAARHASEGKGARIRDAVPEKGIL